MSLIVKEGVSFKNVNAGTHPARCVRGIDIGTQHSEYLGKPKTKKQIIISWELPTELIPEGDYAGQPYMVSKFYTNSLGTKKFPTDLCKDLEAWRGRAFTAEERTGFDIKKVVGAPCMLSIIHNENGKTKINGVLALPKGMTVPEQINPSIFFDIEEWNQEVFDQLTPGIQNLIMASDEYNFKNQDVDKGDEPPPIEDNSEIPF